MRALTAVRRASWLLLGLGGLYACTYSPDFDDGKLLCGLKNSCPKGYHCVAGHTCSKDGSNDTGAGGTGTGGAAGTGGNGGVPDRNTLVGTWDFASGSLTITCSDGTSQTKNLTTADTIDVTAGGSASTVVADYYCPWVLDFKSTASTATGTIKSGQTCMSTGGCTDFTWMGNTFNFSSGDGATGQADGAIAATYKDFTNPLTPNDTTTCLPSTVTPKSGTCTLTVTGPLTKE